MDWYIPFTKTIFMNICIIYTFLRVINTRSIKVKGKLEIVSLIILFAFAYVALKSVFNPLFCYFIYYLLIWLVMVWIYKLEIKNSIILLIISIGFSLFSLFIATSIMYLILDTANINLESYSLIECLIIGMIQYILLYLFFMIKRFKDGIPIFKGIKNGNNNYLGVLICTITILITVIIGTNKDYSIRIILIMVLIFGGIYLFYWIKKNITKHYKQKMKDRTVEILEDSIKEKDEEINELKDELSKALEINHKYNHRLSAMEKAVASLGDAPSFNEEFAKEYSDVLDSLKEFSEEYKKEVELLNKHDELPKTKIFSIDNLLEYMKSEAENNKIEFKLEVNIDVNELINSKIEKCKLETMLADHIRDAIIAIISNEKANNGRIKVIFDKIEECFEVHVLDNGIEFEINTLLKLGLKPVTTHKISGGSGIGFMTTFNTLDDTKASLIIREFDASKEQDYTKDIVIRFDEKNEYVIESYRSEEIKIKDKENRIIIKEISAKKSKNFSQ